MTRIIECVPNFSEGRDLTTLQTLVDLASSIAGVALLDWSADESHNRSVFTLAGDPEAVVTAAFDLCQQASRLIDLNQHQGEHPRMGATDVIPLIPVRDVSIDECVAMSKALAKRIADELEIPVFLYESSATSPGRRNLADIRRGQFEGLAEKLTDATWTPDYGGPKPHPTAGVTAVGARGPLIAFNVNLDTDRLDVAKAIARAVRGSSGGFAACKAMAVTLDQGLVQVSMNMVDYVKTPLYRVFETIRFEAARWGVRILSSEVVGLCPSQALVDSASYYLQIADFDFHRQVLEQHFI